MNLRRLTLSDMDAAAGVLRTSFDAALPTLAGLHTPSEDRWFFREKLFPATTMWGAFDENTLLAFMALHDDWIDQLYVVPDGQRRGLGTRLLTIAKGASPVLNLWTFQRNGPARRFYEGNGFHLVATTDGSRNEEREPDAQYRWVQSETRRS